METRQGDRKRGSGEPCLRGNLLIQLGENLSSEPKTLTGSICLVELQRGLGVAFTY